MIATRVRTADLPVEQRFEAWRELAGKAHVPVLLDSDQRADFTATLEFIDLGSIQLTRSVYPPIRARRTAALVRASDPEMVLLTCVDRGVMVVDRGRRQVRVPAGSIVAIDTSRPVTTMSPGAAGDTIMNFPVSLLGLRRAQLEAILATPVGADSGIGGLLGYLVRDLLRHAGSYEPAAVTLMTATVVDLLATLARLATGARRAVPPGGQERIRQIRIYSYMQEHLADPALTPETVAAAHGLSVRHLDRVLRADGDSPATWIRRQRLQRCGRDLVDPAHAEQTVAAIGARWGFPDPASFNRAFRAEYGVPPGEYRRRYATQRAE